MKLPDDITAERAALKWSVIIFAAYVAVLVISCCVTCYGQDTDPDVRAINAYVDYFHRLVRPSRARLAKRLTWTIVRESRQRALDPLLVAVLVSLESGYRSDAKGARDERGLLQLMPAHCRGCDLDTPVGQIRAGTDRLAAAFAECKTLSGALTHYACGRCKSNSVRTRKKIQWRVRYYKKMKERFHGKQGSPS